MPSKPGWRIAVVVSLFALGVTLWLARSSAQSASAAQHSASASERSASASERSADAVERSNEITERYHQESQEEARPDFEVFADPVPVPSRTMPSFTTGKVEVTIRNNSTRAMTLTSVAVAEFEPGADPVRDVVLTPTEGAPVSTPVPAHESISFEIPGDVVVGFASGRAVNASECQLVVIASTVPITWHPDQTWQWYSRPFRVYE